MKFLGRTVLVAFIESMCAIGAVAQELRNSVDPCQRFERFSAETLLTAFDLVALKCLADGRASPDATESEQLLASLIFDFSTNNAVRPLEQVAEWLSQDPSVKGEIIEISLRALRNWHVARQQESRARILHEALKLPVNRVSALAALDAARGIDAEPMVEAVLTNGQFVNLKTDKRGRLYADAAIGGDSVRVIFDTGASTNFTDESLARRLGLKFNDADPLTGWTDVGQVDFLSAGAPAIDVGGLRLDGLRFSIAPVGSDLDTGVVVLGAPTLKAIGRLAWLDRGKRLAFGASAPPPRCIGSVGRVHDMQPVLTIDGMAGSGLAPSIFDSGFVVPYLNERAARFYSPEVRFSSDSAYWFERPESRGGGVSTRGVKKFRMSIGDADITLRNVRAYAPMETGPLGYVAWLGTDVLKQIETLVIDFETMTFAAAPKGAELPACADDSTGE